MMEKIEFLPGEITDPHWPGVRCKVCGRPMGGNEHLEGWTTCDDVPQAHTTLDTIPKDIVDKFYLDQVWSNVQAELGLPDAIQWMAAGPLERIEAGNGQEVFNELLAEYPIIGKALQAARQLQ